MGSGVRGTAHSMLGARKGGGGTVTMGEEESTEVHVETDITAHAVEMMM